MIFSKDPRNYWFMNLIVIAFFMILVLLYKRQDLTPYFEGFVQNKPFIYKKNLSACDEFYAEIYDQLQTPEQRNIFVLDKTIEMTKPTLQNSVFLEINTKTGSFLKLMQDAGYNAHGIEPSNDMILYSKEKHNGLEKLKCGFATDSMLYEKNTFTHVICKDLHFYEYANKNIFFQNCYFWLKGGGYLILQLVDPKHFDPIIPGGKPSFLKSPQKYSSQRITDTMIDFIDFKYKGSFDFSDLDKHNVCLKETFTDELTKNVRQNEFNYTMEPLEDIMKLASLNGFIVQGQVNLEHCTGDEHQHLLILERPN